MQQQQLEDWSSTRQQQQLAVLCQGFAADSVILCQLTGLTQTYCGDQ
jgi:hypothetical protein